MLGGYEGSDHGVWQYKEFTLQVAHWSR